MAIMVRNNIPMRVVRYVIAIVLVSGFFRLFPLFHVVQLTNATEQTRNVFDAAQFAESFWNGKLIPSAHSSSVRAGVLLPAILADAAAARRKYAHGAGLGDTYFYFVSGSGRVKSVADAEVTLTVTNAGNDAEVSLETGLVFGDALRDGTGLLNPSDFPNSQNFNDISAALDHIAESRVLPALRKEARVGANIAFAGCAEVDDESTDLRPLKVIPIETVLQ
jgi:predicted lipoprotein